MPHNEHYWGKKMNKTVKRMLPTLEAEFKAYFIGKLKNDHDEAEAYAQNTLCAFCAEFGGLNFYLPMYEENNLFELYMTDFINHINDKYFNKKVSNELAKILREFIYSHFKGKALYIPITKQLNSIKLKQSVILMYENGKKPLNISEIFKISLSYTYQIIKNHKGK